uniref:Uncharacterized protein n=1 Tax=Pan paniscus TaxID=9597 RepID=A0A2R8ZJ24_PANPA
MGSKLTCCLGPSGGLNCDCCRPDVGPCHECEIPETVAAAAPASTTAKPAKLDLKAKKAQLMQYLNLPKTPKMPKMPKGKEAMGESCMHILLVEMQNGPIEDAQASAHGGVEENMTSDIVRYLVEDLSESLSVCLEDFMTSDLSESLSVSLEDFMTSGLSESQSVSLEDLMTLEMMKSCSFPLGWVKMARSRLN